jgi:maleylacetate reductase
MADADVERVADLALAAPYANPRPVTREGVVALLERAWAGDPPS